MAILLVLFPAAFTQAQQEQTVDGVPGNEVPRYFTFTFENDLFVGEDNGYTNGLGLTFGKGPFREFNDTNLPRWLQPLISNSYLNRGEGMRRGVAHMYAQRMQTPQDITVAEPIEGDLPYAGLLAWQGTFYEYNEFRSDQVSLSLGIVGPASLAEQGQSIIHTITGSDQPEGWNLQLKNELVGRVEALRVWKLARSTAGPRGWDVLGLGGVGLGTLQSGMGAGIAMRWGSNLEYTHSTFSLEADRQVNPLAIRESNGFYAYAGAKAGVVFNDVLVQGNTFTDSHSAELEHWQNQLSAGLVWSMGKLAYVFQLSTFSSHIESTDKREKYGALSVTFRY
ncbi:lipid A deacylase LpxR family protein [Granulosicoccus sp. 3-233]|uniref:lipid A deacylase LpxR family protein n=1 Tax=Granulosicoccus sp. 3-233 TaxID=3417969 RepID=UPI003D3397FF